MMCNMVSDVLFVSVLFAIEVMEFMVCMSDCVKASSVSILVYARCTVLLVFFSALVRPISWVCTGWVLVVRSCFVSASW